MKNIPILDELQQAKDDAVRLAGELTQLEKKYNKDIQILNERLTDKSLSHLHASARDLDKYRELEAKYQQLKSFLHQIDLSPCNGGSCMVATTVDENLDAMKLLHKL